MRIVFCGSGQFAVPSLEAIRARGHDIVGVVTQPARRAGRGGRPRPTPLSVTVRRAGLDVRECDNVNTDESVESIRRLGPDVICVVDFGQLVRRAVRETARLDSINLHASLLPALRGAAPINWAIIRGLRQTGVSVFSLVDRMDAGPIYRQAQTDIRPEETAAELGGRLAELGAKVMCETLDMLADGRAVGRRQDESAATEAPRMNKADGIIDWSADAQTIRNLIHGTWPWPGARSIFARPGQPGLTVTIARAAAEPGQSQPRPPGQLDADLCVVTGAGRVRILQIKPTGRCLMDWRDFVNGYRARQGDTFTRAEK